MSKDGAAIIRRMLTELSSCKYGYRSVVDGCYLTSIGNYGMVEPEETMGSIVDMVIEILNTEQEE